MIKKDQIEKIRIEINYDKKPALQLFLHKDGTMERHGSGRSPIEETFTLGIIEKDVFKQLIEEFDENLFEKQGVYILDDNSGIELHYSLILIGPKPELIRYIFYLGTETKETNPLLTYIDQFIKKAISLTDKWYKNEQTH